MTKTTKQTTISQFFTKSPGGAAAAAVAKPEAVANDADVAKESPAKRKAASPKKKASTNGTPAKKVKVAKVKAPPADELEENVPPTDDNVSPKKKKNMTEKEWPCPECPKVFNKQRKLNLHMKIHSDDAIQCDLCENKFVSEQHKKAHMLWHTGNRQYKCEICNKKFYNSTHLITHKRVHTNERPYACDLCPKRFTVSGALVVHRRIHTGERPYECQHCDKAFRESGKLRLHMLVHTGEKPFKCGVCGAGFAQRGNMLKHENTHDPDNRKFNCSICGKSFTSKSYLKTHENFHTGNKAHECMVCKASFVTKTEHQIHLASHTGVKKFKCHICFKEMIQGAHLKAHLEMHDKPDKTQCPICMRFILWKHYFKDVGKCRRCADTSRVKRKYKFNSEETKIKTKKPKKKAKITSEAKQPRGTRVTKVVTTTPADAFADTNENEPEQTNLNTAADPTAQPQTNGGMFVVLIGDIKQEVEDMVDVSEMSENVADRLMEEAVMPRSSQMNVEVNGKESPPSKGTGGIKIRSDLIAQPPTDSIGMDTDEPAKKISNGTALFSEYRTPVDMEEPDDNIMIEHNFSDF